jgi:hypothetical protein
MMWIEDLEQARMADHAYANMLFLQANAMAEDPRLIPFIPKNARLAAKQYGLTAEWLRENAALHVRPCPLLHARSSRAMRSSAPVHGDRECGRLRRARSSQEQVAHESGKGRSRAALHKRMYPTRAQVKARFQPSSMTRSAWSSMTTLSSRPLSARPSTPC